MFTLFPPNVTLGNRFCKRRTVHRLHLSICENNTFYIKTPLSILCSFANLVLMISELTKSSVHIAKHITESKVATCETYDTYNTNYFCSNELINKHASVRKQNLIKDDDL